MKVAFLNKYQGKVARGAETFVNELAVRLSKRHEVDVFSKVNYLKLLSGKYDIIVPVNGRLQVFLARAVSWLGGAKMVVSGQSGAGLDDRINLYALPDRFVALSEYQKVWARKVNPLVKVAKIPNGVDLSRFSPKKDGGKNLVLSVGAFTKEKRHDLTIRAVSKLEDVKLLIVGGGGDRKEQLEKMGIDLLGGERFEVRSVAHEKMPGIYGEASLLAFPSVSWESFGIVLVEAMASGLPVVATDDPIRREIVGDAGILVDPKDTDEYSKAIKKALETDWKDKPRKQAEKFDWEAIAKKYEELFEGLV